jgi:hypothetical protein
MIGMPSAANASARVARRLPTVGVAALLVLGLGACQSKIAVVGPAPTVASIPASTASGLTAGLSPASAGAHLTSRPAATTALPSGSRR